jgi:hypothetical protein
MTTRGDDDEDDKIPDASYNERDQDDDEDSANDQNRLPSPLQPLPNVGLKLIQNYMSLTRNIEQVASFNFPALCFPANIIKTVCSSSAPLLMPV